MYSGHAQRHARKHFHGAGVQRVAVCAAQRAGKALPAPGKGAEQRIHVAPLHRMRRLTGVHQPHLRLGRDGVHSPLHRFCGPQLGGKVHPHPRGFYLSGVGAEAAGRVPQTEGRDVVPKLPGNKAGVGFAKAAVWSRVVQRAEIVVQHQPRGPGGCVQGADLRRIFHPRLIGDAVYCVRGRKVLPHKALEGKHKAGGHTVVAVPSAGDEVYTVPHARRGKCFGHTGVDSSHALVLFPWERGGEDLMRFLHQHHLADGCAGAKLQQLTELALPGIFVHGNAQNIFHKSTTFSV